MALLSDDPDLHAAAEALLKIGEQATAETFTAMAKIGAAITSGIPVVLTDLEAFAAHRGIAMLPADVGGVNVRAEAQLAAGLVAGLEPKVNDAVASTAAKEIGVVLQRLRAALPGGA
jgi:hypothetical protein